MKGGRRGIKQRRNVCLKYFFLPMSDGAQRVSWRLVESHSDPAIWGIAWPVVRQRISTAQQKAFISDVFVLFVYRNIWAGLDWASEARNVNLYPTSIIYFNSLLKFWKCLLKAVCQKETGWQESVFLDFRANKNIRPKYCIYYNFGKDELKIRGYNCF